MSKQIQKPMVRLLVAVNNEALILKRSQNGSRAGAWELPGGGVDFGETFEGAAKQKLEEETGLKAPSLELLDTYSETGDNDMQRLGVLYSVALAVLPEVRLSDEHQEYAWVNSRSWKEYNLTTASKGALAEHFKGEVTENVDYSTSIPGTEHVIIFADGGSRGNPGPSATGYAIFDTNESEIARGGEYIGITTNNQAEYLAVKQGLRRALELGAKTVEFYLDSMLVVNQMKGIYKVRNKDLWPVHKSIKQLTEDIDVTFEHVRREKNKVADSIVNEVLDKREDEQ